MTIAPSSAAGFLSSALLYRKAGYRVELVVLAVRAADSRQGTADRCARVQRLGGAGRFTTASGHDTHFAALAEAVAAAERSALADSVMVLRRDGSVLYRTDAGSRKGRASAASAAGALFAEQTRPYTDQEAARFWNVQHQLRAELPHYRADLDQIAQLARPLMPAHLQQRHLPGAAATAALPLPRPCEGHNPPAPTAAGPARTP